MTPNESLRPNVIPLRGLPAAELGRSAAGGALMFEVAVRGEGGEFLTITIIGRSYPGSTDYWNGNWLQASIEVSAGGFRGEVACDLRADELAAFAEQMACLQESFRGEAAFDTLEGWLSLRVIGDGRGHMEFRCVVRDQPGVGNRLECVFNTDQTFTRSTVAELAAVVQAFPVVDRP